ncbi:polyribonucleotide nucleotidyltransferase [Patescibacteria group bacterium]|nr:polyribonucleotide nucleotidyltransferase [Patescibacteria group bacterium]
MTTQSLSTDYGTKPLTIETGKLARLAGGAVTLRWGDTLVLATTNIGHTAREGVNYFPLMVDYEEKYYAAGKIVGSRFIKREGRPSEIAVLTSRLIDRPLRPLFPGEFRRDIQVIISVLSLDQDHDPSTAATIAASCSLLLAEAPFSGPVAACRVASVDGQLVAHPTKEQLENSDLDLMVSGTIDSVMMIEAGANQVPEETITKAIELAQSQLAPVIKIQQELAAQLGKKPMEYAHDPIDESAQKLVEQFFADNDIISKIKNHDKLQRDSILTPLQEKLIKEHGINSDTGVEQENKIGHNILYDLWEKNIKKGVRKLIFKDNVRIDGRKLDEVRPIECETGVSPRVHGTGLFTRGYTQILTNVTLGSTSDEQIVEGMSQETTKRYMHHYNFPPFSVGEVRPMRGPGRREIGHGALAEKALRSVIPSKEDFPYTIRLVSEALSSDGSTSMGSTCGSTLALMDAGVPISTPISGIAMGLMINQQGEYKILTDIAGHEDHFGDMDFKVAGSNKGITALQMDIKVKGIGLDIIKDAIKQAKSGRDHILSKMLAVIDKPRAELSPHAPRVITVKIKPDQIGSVIGPQGKTINEIIEKTDTTIDIEEDGNVFIFGHDAKKCEQAAEIVKNITKEVVAGETFEGTVTRIMDFGAFVEILPKQEGLVHISELAPFHVKKVTDIVKVGDKIKVKVKEIDDLGRINLTAKDSGLKPKSPDQK